MQPNCRALIFFHLQNNGLNLSHYFLVISPLEVTLTESNILQVVVSTVGLLFVGKLLEPIWGSREFLKFIFVVNFLTSLCVFITAIALYYITQEESYL